MRRLKIPFIYRVAILSFLLLIAGRLVAIKRSKKQILKLSVQTQDSWPRRRLARLPRRKRAGATYHCAWK